MTPAQNIYPFVERIRFMLLLSRKMVYFLASSICALYRDRKIRTNFTELL